MNNEIPIGKVVTIYWSQYIIYSSTFVLLHGTQKGVADETADKQIAI